MKRKLDKNKIYAFIGKTVVFLSANLMWTGLMILGFMQNTIYQEEEKMNLAILILINIVCFGIGYVLGKFKQQKLSSLLNFDKQLQRNIWWQLLK